MNDVIGRVFGFERDVFGSDADLYSKLATDGQSPKVLMISCSDSRVVPEHVLQAKPGDVFVIRNAGNIVPPSPSRMAERPLRSNMPSPCWASPTSSCRGIPAAARWAR